MAPFGQDTAGAASRRRREVREVDGPDPEVEPASVRNLYVAPANLDLAGAEIELVPAFSREMKLRNAINEGRVDGPRMFVAGAYITVPGGGGEVRGNDVDSIPPEFRRGAPKIHRAPE